MKLKIILLTLIIITCLLSGCWVYNFNRDLSADADIKESQAEIMKLRVDCLKRKQADPKIDCSEYNATVDVNVKTKGKE